MYSLYQIPKTGNSLKEGVLDMSADKTKGGRKVGGSDENPDIESNLSSVGNSDSKGNCLDPQNNYSQHDCNSYSREDMRNLDSMSCHPMNLKG